MNKKSTLSPIEIRFLVSVIYFITADKGGTGKSFTARAIIDALIEAGLGFTLLECDIGIPDTAKIFNVASGYNIDTSEGWRSFYDALIAAPKDRPTIVTMPAGFLHRARTHMPYLPTGWCEATGSEHGQSRRNEGLRGLTKADSVAA